MEQIPHKVFSFCGMFSLCAVKTYVENIPWKPGFVFKLLNSIKGAYFPHSWEDINPEINCRQMLYSARISQLPPTNVQLLHSNYKHCPKITLAVITIISCRFHKQDYGG